MKRCAYLTMEVPDGWTIDADLAFPYMEQLGWQIVEVQWQKAQCKWNDFDAVYVGTPWDYPSAAQQFIELLKEIHISSAILINDYSLIKWNIAKTYLRDLEALGIAIVPALWCRNLSMDSVFAAFDNFGVDNIIVKPVISTNATDTFLLNREISLEMQSRLAKTFKDRDFMLQPFISSIEEEGEYSLFYFGGVFSHAIQKVPKKSDFRVQEEFGADIRVFKPDSSMIDVGLTYVRLGQNATTLSGGEAQRVKLAKELSKRDTGNTLYILDEPTTGLHFHDIEHLLAVLHRLRDKGNTVVVIEHNLDVIKTADWVVDLGPEGGDGGGQIIATGTPEDVAGNEASFTGQYLKPLLETRVDKQSA